MWTNVDLWSKVFSGIHPRAIDIAHKLNQYYVFEDYTFEITLLLKSHLTYSSNHFGISACTVPDSKVHVAHMGPTWDLSAPGGPYAGPMNIAIRGVIRLRTVQAVHLQGELSPLKLLRDPVWALWPF